MRFMTGLLVGAALTVTFAAQLDWDEVGAMARDGWQELRVRAEAVREQLAEQRGSEGIDDGATRTVAAPVRVLPEAPALPDAEDDRALVPAAPMVAQTRDETRDETRDDMRDETSGGAPDGALDAASGNLPLKQPEGASPETSEAGPEQRAEFLPDGGELLPASDDVEDPPPGTAFAERSQLESAQPEKAVTVPATSPAPAEPASGVPVTGVASVWTPFYSERSAAGFAERLTQALDEPFSVAREERGRYRVLFSYRDADHREQVLQQVELMTGFREP